MKKHNRLIGILLAAALMFSFTACGGNEPPAPAAPQQSPAQSIEKNETPTQPESKPDESSETVPEVTAEPEKPEENISENSFSAADAVTVEEVSNGVKYTFHTMPVNAQDIQALIDEFGLSDRHNTTAFFMAAYVRYAENEDDGLAMIDVLKGPQPLSDSDKAFIRERLSDKKYLPKSYFEGAKPENNYEPDTPWTIVVSDEAVSAPEGYSYTTVSSGGADSPRRVCLRIKGDDHYLWEYNGVFLSIRLPAEEDPWL